MKLDVERINKARRSHGADPLPVPKQGRPSIGPAPSRAELVDAYQRQGLSIRAAAEVLGMSKDMVQRGLVEHGIKARTMAKRSRLRAFSTAAIEATIGEHKMKRAAALLGVGLRTLQDYRARQRGAKGRK